MSLLCHKEITQHINILFKIFKNCYLFIVVITMSATLDLLWNLLINWHLRPVIISLQRKTKPKPDPRKTPGLTVVKTLTPREQTGGVAICRSTPFDKTIYKPTLLTEWPLVLTCLLWQGKNEIKTILVLFVMLEIITV